MNSKDCEGNIVLKMKKPWKTPKIYKTGKMEEFARDESGDFVFVTLCGLEDKKRMEYADVIMALKNGTSSPGRL